MAAAVDHEGVSGVLLGADVSREVKVSLISVASERGLPVYVVPGIYEIMLCQSRLEQLNGFPVLRLMSTASRSSAAWKRLSDVVLVLICAGPATLLILLSAIALRLESPRGDIFYRQQRVGQGGRVFDIVKLRTMVPEAEMATGPILAAERDPRITRVGRALRAARIDELPQLWNVLKGDISFVGPRPERPFFVDQFRKEIPLYDCRHQVKGGITGLAQVEGQYSTSAEDKLQYDLLYTKTQSLIKDLHILLNTLKVMLMRSKSM
jgi:exopolysaccharide biosynthesis polyprenyl glycosylphosphotransferase